MRARLVLLLALAACSMPEVAPGLDLYTCDGGLCPAQGEVRGSVSYQGTSRGDVFLLLFDAQSLPPPQGTASSAVAVARVTAQQLFGSQSGAGPFSAPFAFTEVPSNRAYQIRAFLDVSGRFNPFFDFTLSPRAGSVAGGYGQIVNGVPEFLSVAVAPNQIVTGVGVALFETLPYDPPAFTIAGGAQTLDTHLDRPAPLTLQIAHLTAPDATLPNAHFFFEADTSPPVAFGDGITDVFPRVALQQIADASGNPAASAEIPCRTLPTALLPALPLAADTLQALIEPIAVDQVTLQPLAQIPAGRYRVVVIEKSGQVWAVPNSLGEPSRAPDYDPSQAASISFVDQPFAGAGSISGSIVWQGGAVPKSGNVIVQAFLDDPLNPPPPLGVQQPVRVSEILASQVAATASGFSTVYTLSHLPAGNYLVEALDDADANFAPLDLLETPTRGDLLGEVVDLGTLRPRSIAVSDSAVTGQDILLQGPVGLDPPAFKLAAPASMAADATAPVRFDLRAAPFDFPMGAVAAPVFTVSLVLDAQGATVDADSDGLPDVWPRVFLVRLDANDPSGLTLASPLQAIPAAVDPTPFMPALLATEGHAGTLGEDRVTVVARPALVDAATGRRSNPAPGKYGIVVENKTGQVWRIPNSAGPLALDPAAAALADTGTQSDAFEVTLPAKPLLQTAIIGSLQINQPFFSAYIFAFSAADPPPPLGTGQPVSGDFHTASEAQNGLLQFSIPDLPLGDYLVEAIVDTRGDFALSPQLFALAPGPGTLVAQAGPVTLTDSAPVASVNLAATQALPARPGFVLRDANGATIETDLTNLFPDALTPARISLHAQAVLDARVSPLADTDGPAFLVSYRGCDANGAPLDSDGDGLPDLYPRVLVVKLADADPSGLTPDPARIVIPAAIDPTRFSLGACAQHLQQAVSDLSVILASIAVDAVTGASLAIPAGRYGVVVMQSTGQTWRIPNELQPALLDPASNAAVDLGAQGVSLRIGTQVPPALPGSIEGTVQLDDFAQTGAGDLLVAAYAASAPPPPQGLGRPLAVQSIPRAAVAGQTIPFALTNLAPGSYLVAAELDPLGELSPLLSFLSTPPRGAQVSFTPAPIAVGTAAVTGVTISIAASQPAIPFERPSFSLAGSALTLSSSSASGTQAVLTLTPDVPAGLPYAVAASPVGYAFHPVPTGARDQTSVCGGGASHGFVASQVYVTPLDTGSTLVPFVHVDPCQFCLAITGNAGCNGPPVAAPVMSTPMQAVVENVAIDPATLQLANAPVPPGHYAVTLIEETGQSWTVPNELAASDATQAAVFTVTP